MNIATRRIAVSDTQPIPTAPEKASWVDRLLGRAALKPSAAQSYRYLARQIDAELGELERGKALTIGGPGGLDLTNRSLLMLSYCLQDELGCTVLMIDGTLCGEGIGACLGHGKDNGFANVLYGERAYELETLIQPTVQPGVFVLPAGSAPAGASVSALKARAGSLMRQACALFDYVVVEQGSVLTDMRHLWVAPLVDLMLLLVEEGGTSLDDLEGCRRILGSRQVEKVRLLLSTPWPSS